MSVAADVSAIVVTYNPDLEILQRVLHATHNQVATVTVVDNDSENAPRIQELCQLKNAEFISCRNNLGLGYAHNYGIRAAKERGRSHVLLLDQDSIPAPDMVARMLEAERAAQESGDNVGAIGARYVGRYAGNESFFVRFGLFKFHHVFCPDEGQRFVRADFLISSGTLVPMSAINTVGLMDEDLFIDHIDTDWFLRANRCGCHSFGACDAVMEHGLGDRTLRIWIGRWRYLPVHQPFRYYYIFRNSLLMYRRSYAPWRWVVNDMVRLVFILFFYTVFGEGRIQRLRMIARGVTDGIRGVSGHQVAPGRA